MCRTMTWEVEMACHRIAVIAGDGIGREVVPEGMRVLDAAASKFGFDLQWDELPWDRVPWRGVAGVSRHDASKAGLVRRPGPAG